MPLPAHAQRPAPHQAHRQAADAAGWRPPHDQAPPAPPTLGTHPRPGHPQEPPTAAHPAPHAPPSPRGHRRNPPPPQAPPAPSPSHCHRHRSPDHAPGHATPPARTTPPAAPHRSWTYDEPSTAHDSPEPATDYADPAWDAACEHSRGLLTSPESSRMSHLENRPALNFRDQYYLIKLDHDKRSPHIFRFLKSNELVIWNRSTRLLARRAPRSTDEEIPGWTECPGTRSPMGVPSSRHTALPLVGPAPDPYPTQRFADHPICARLRQYLRRRHSSLLIRTVPTHPEAGAAGPRPHAGPVRRAVR